MADTGDNLRTGLRARAVQGREKGRELIGSVKERGRELATKARARMDEVRRRVITGDKDKRVRDFMAEPPVVRTRDKLSFTLGVLGLVITEAVLVHSPRYYGMWYAVLITILLIMRYFMYKKQKAEYFMLDFCYFANLACMLDNFVPLPRWFAQGLFVAVCGPICWAIPVWRNSLVFHSLDKITSTFIHLLPALYVYCTRWYPWSSEVDLCADGSNSLSVSGWLLIPLASYALWQCIYSLVVEVVDRERIKDDPELWTSMRWIMSVRRHPLRDALLVGLRKVGIMAPDEVFNSEETKSKVVFIIAQFFYTVLTILPSKLFYESQLAHSVFLIAIFLGCVWNGASFYVEVFARSYWNKFQEMAENERSAQEQTEESGGSSSPDEEDARRESI